MKSMLQEHFSIAWRVLPLAAMHPIT